MASKYKVNYRLLFEASADAMLIIDGEKFVDCNQATLDMLGMENREKLFSTHPSQLSPEFQLDGRRSFEKANEMITIAKEKGSNRFEWIHTRNNGENFSVEVLLTHVPFEERGLLHVVSRDITERKKTEEALKKIQLNLEKLVDERTKELVEAEEEASNAKRAIERERQKFYDMLDNLPIAFHLQAPDYSVPFANKMFRNLYGEPNKTCYELMHNRTAPCEPCSTFKVFNHNRKETSIWTSETGKTFLTVCTPFADIDGSPLIMEMALDISEQENIKREAEKANLAKSNFLARMSHELRTPMNAILGFTQLLAMDSKNFTDLQNENLGRVSSAGHHLLELINEVLDLSRVESGKMKLSIETIDAALIMDEVISFIRPFATESAISLECSKAISESCFVKIDPLRFKQVVLNLISNAIKYNKPNGSVFVSYEKQEKGMIRLGIRDTGCGIPEDKRDKLFTPFERFDLNADSIDGTGIGLTISKQLIELMNGTIGFESDAGKGSFFYIDIPTSDKAPLIKVEDTVESAQLSLANISKKKILYIEDIPANVELVKLILRDEQNIDLISAYTAIAGIELAQSEAIDLILMDIHMPEMDGLTAFNKLQAINKTKNIPIIALSADAMDTDIKKVLDMGFKDYITKPIDVAKFLKIISKTLA
jgi:PAS domain S-box-containing protein